MGFVFLIFLVLAFLVAWHEGRLRKCGFGGALILMLLFSPFFGYFLMLLFPLKDPRGCQWCGNKENEAEFCGLCNKNAAGEMRSLVTLK
jgi:hypothetical protein